MSPYPSITFQGEQEKEHSTLLYSTLLPLYCMWEGCINSQSVQQSVRQQWQQATVTVTVCRCDRDDDSVQLIFYPRLSGVKVGFLCIEKCVRCSTLQSCRTIPYYDMLWHAVTWLHIYHTMLWHVVTWHTIPYHTILWHTVTCEKHITSHHINKRCTAQYGTKHRTVPCRTAQYTQHCTVQCSTIPYSTIQLTAAPIEKEKKRWPKEKRWKIYLLFTGLVWFVFVSCKIV